MRKQLEAVGTTAYILDSPVIFKSNLWHMFKKKKKLIKSSSSIRFCFPRHISEPFCEKSNLCCITIFCVILYYCFLCVTYDEYVVHIHLYVACLRAFCAYLVRAHYFVSLGLSFNKSCALIGKSRRPVGHVPHTFRACHLWTTPSCSY